MLSVQIVSIWSENPKVNFQLTVACYTHQVEAEFIGSKGL